MQPSFLRSRTSLHNGRLVYRVLQVLKQTRTRAPCSVVKTVANLGVSQYALAKDVKREA